MRREWSWILLGLVLSSVVLAGGAALGGPPLLKEAKDAGMPARNCQYCHTAIVPKKETFTPGELNERGRWLLVEKARRKADKVNPAWLKAYPGGPEQK